MLEEQHEDSGGSNGGGSEVDVRSISITDRESSPALSHTVHDQRLGMSMKSFDVLMSFLTKSPLSLFLEMRGLHQAGQRTSTTAWRIHLSLFIGGVAVEIRRYAA